MAAGRKTSPASNLYTVVLSLATLATVATAVFVSVMCKIQYGTLFEILKP